jgi:hypothetical protein
VSAWIKRDNPLEDLKKLLCCEEYTDVDAVIVDAIDEIENLREQVGMGPNERERRFLDRMNERDEANSQFMARWLENRSMTDRTAIATWRIMSEAITTMQGAMCNFTDATNGHGRKVPIQDMIDVVTRRVEEKFQRLMQEARDAT